MPRLQRLLMVIDSHPARWAGLLHFALSALRIRVFKDTQSP